MKLLIPSMVFLLCCCSSYHPIESNKDFESERLQIMESVFRYLIRANTDQSTSNVFCLSIALKKDPPTELLLRFRDLSTVKKYTDCEIAPRVGDPIGIAVEKMTHNTALILFVDDLQWKNSTGVRIKAGYFAGSLSAASAFYYLLKENGCWKIVKEKLIAIS